MCSLLSSFVVLLNCLDRMLCVLLSVVFMLVMFLLVLMYVVVLVCGLSSGFVSSVCVSGLRLVLWVICVCVWCFGLYGR